MYRALDRDRAGYVALSSYSEFLGRLVPAFTEAQKQKLLYLLDESSTNTLFYEYLLSFIIAFAVHTELRLTNLRRKLFLESRLTFYKLTH